ncbi:DNA polymerase III, subunit gamma and tau [Pelobium manganitolerans]|uniref:DNA polymerase III subunit gamma/tau n=1 Tax=Pelobium manganitolerans TaxID=1842495 RepID=A0A419S8Z7_9SPHI|nr:DNA polymerase III subunit gamma/tau [Pelobium manganitolerans]RKD18255.1 DNA polymerase III, subunit gamma and tau [Pelobium manganitolerans]
MENFIVSARKYRPVLFESVVGQSHITNTLKNAIKNNQLAQAFLFCGPRGVGKTTCARILAKTINCTNLTADHEACGVCESCVSFQNGNSFNFHELDAASNNSVDDIRNLIDQVRIPPQAGKYKVYIIDEVHMLSQSAFNAFLKTLEEPPAYAIFILATTEKHKILPTILSRCQIFDFNRIRVEDMAQHLAGIATKENVSYDMDGLHLIAQKADGGLRDALSMFDQIVSFSNRALSYQAVIDNLNILDYDYYFKLTDLLLAQDTPGALLLFDDILNNGFDGNHFITGLASHLRNVLICRDASTVKLLEVSENIKAKYLEQARLAPASFLLSALNIANQCDLNYRLSKNQRLQVELTLMKISHLAQALQLSQSENVQQLAEQLKKKPKTLAAEAEVSYGKTEPVVTPKPQIPVSSEKKAVESVATPVPGKPSAAPLPSAGKSLLNRDLKASIIPNLKDPSSIKSEDNAEAEKVILSGVERQPFTQEDLIKQWVTYSGIVKAQNKMSLVAILENYTPILKENFRIELPIENKLQETELTYEKIDLLNFLRQKLLNFQISLDPVITEIKEGKKLYTAKDKYLHMAEKNPALDEFRKVFNLDLN